MGRRTEWDAFSAVDDQPDADALLDRLERFRELPPVARVEERSLELMGLGHGSAVLDVGCGTGGGLELMAQRGFKATGIDASLTALDRARACSTATLVAGDAAELPFADCSFEGVRCVRVLQHLEAPERALSEAWRVLRPDGRLVVVEGTQTLSGAVSEEAEELHREISRTELGRGWAGLFLEPMLRRAKFCDVALEVVRGSVSLGDPSASAFLGLPHPASNARIELTMLICSGSRS